MSERQRHLAEDREWIRRLFDQVVPYTRTLGIRTMEIGDGEAYLELPFRDDLVGNPMTGALHGGVISSLLDTCGGVALWSQVGLDSMVSTVDLRVDFLRPAVGGGLRAHGTVVRLGNRVGVVQLRAWHPEDADRPVAAGVGVYTIRGAREVNGGSIRERLRDLAL